MTDLIAVLLGTAEDPAIYLPLLFVFSTLAAILLPIPVELGLLNPFVPFWALILVAAGGKALGGALVFPLGASVGARVERWTRRFPKLAGIYRWITDLVGRYGYAGLFGLLAIPLMTDSIPVYAFSILNPPEPPASAAPAGAALPSRARRSLRRGPFVAVNFASALVRCSAFLALPVLFGWP